MADRAEICMNTRLAASAVKATTMDRPEWVAANPLSPEVYCCLTNNKHRGRRKNEGGDAMPCHVKKLLKLLKVSGWRRNEDEWRAVVSALAVQGCIRATMSDAGQPYEVFWPSRRDDETKQAVEEAVHAHDADAGAEAKGS